MADKQAESFLLDSVKAVRAKRKRKTRSYGACREADSRAKNAVQNGINPIRSISDEGHETDQTTSFISTDPSQSSSNYEYAPVDEDMSNNCTRMARKDFLAVWRIFLLAFVIKFIGFSLYIIVVPYSKLALGLSTSSARTIQSTFWAVSYIVPFFGGIVADEWTGGFISMFASTVIMFIGMCLLLASSWSSSDSIFGDSHLDLTERSQLFIAAIVLVAVGNGIFKPNNIPFGVRHVFQRRRVSLESFMLWTIWYSKAAELVFVTAGIYLINLAGITVVFGSMLILLGFAMIIFLHGKSKFSHQSAQASIFDSIFATIAARIIKRKSWSLPHVQQEQIERRDRLVVAIRSVLRIFPVMPLLILFSLIWHMMFSFQRDQTPRMNSVYYGTWTFPDPIIINFICILILIPVLDRIVYPYLHRRKRSPSLTQKLVLGLVLAMAAMLCTGVLEILRKEDMVANGYIERNQSGTAVNVSKITQAAQIPQYILLGASEAISIEPGLTFMFSEAPNSMKGIFMGIFWLADLIGQILLTLYESFVKIWKTNDDTDWYPEDPNKGHMEYAMFLVIGFICFYLLLFSVYHSKCCRKLMRRRTDEETN